MNFKFLLISLNLILCGCSYTSASIHNNTSLEETYFNVVTKNIILDEEIPISLKKSIVHWFDNKVFLNGLNGSVIISLNNYSEKIIIINQGKKVDISIDFFIDIENNDRSKMRKISGSINSYRTIEGNFSINDFEKLIQQTQHDLVLRLSKDLKKNI